MNGGSHLRNLATDILPTAATPDDSNVLPEEQSEREGWDMVQYTLVSGCLPGL